ncbi:MAG: tetratricopeptide repeat protein [Prosthecobacter sp.]|nr:tetratricopeptide repeat protein [Prosthecobacter sp.]
MALLAVLQYQEDARAQHPAPVPAASYAKTAPSASETSEVEIRAELKEHERVLGAEHPETLRARHHLVNALRAKGEHAEAWEEQRKLRKTMTRLAGPAQPEVLVSRLDMAILAMWTDDKPAKRLQKIRARILIEERVFGAEHPDTLRSRGALASVLFAQEKHEESEQEHRAVLKLRERVLGDQHPDVFVSCFNLALCLEERYKAGESLALMQRAEAGFRKALGPDHPFAQTAKLGVEVIQGKLDEKQPDSGC